MQAFVHKSVMEELKRIIEDSEIMQEDDSAWPSPDRVGRQVILNHNFMSSYNFIFNFDIMIDHLHIYNVHAFVLIK